MANRFDSVNESAEVEVKSWDSHDGLRQAITEGEPLPDAFLVSRRDLRWYTENQLTRPVDGLLDERGVDFGDVYSRDALTAFSSDNRLQCMPYGVAPQVMFYNASLIDFERMAIRGLDVPTDHRRWTFEQFTAAAAFAARPSSRHQGCLGRAHPERAGAIHRLGRRRRLRRRRRPPVAGLLLRRDPVGVGDHVGPAPRSQGHAERGRAG